MSNFEGMWHPLEYGVTFPSHIHTRGEKSVKQKESTIM